MQIEDLDRLKNYDQSQINKYDLIDLSTITVNSKLPIDKRFIQYLEMIKNPYCMRVGETIIEVKFNGSTSIQDRIKEYLRNAKKQSL